MRVAEEKEFIYSMMKDITKERRQLFEMYFDLKKRLDYLNSLEEKGIDELSIDGYIDLYKKREKETILNNIKRETEFQINKIENQYNIEEKEKQEEEENPIIPKKEINESISKERKRRGPISRERIEQTIISILKDAGRPVKNKDILIKLNEILEENIKPNNFQNNILPRAMDNNKKIERASRGFYQYRG